MTQEEKAKAYDKALKRAKDVHTYYCDDREQLRKIESIFPELRKSEDERIKEELITLIQGYEKGCYVAISPSKIKEFTTWLEKQGKRKSEWSEEDRTMAFTLMRDVDQMPYYVSKEGKNERIGWLNSLDEKFTSTESTWSKHDEIMKTHALQIINKYWNSLPDTDYDENEISESCYNWLKSLEQRIRWKPSEEQMIALSEAPGIVGMFTPRGTNLQSLYNDLKKL